MPKDDIRLKRLQKGKEQDVDEMDEIIMLKSMDDVRSGG